MQAVAAELSGYVGKFRCFFGEKSLKTVCLDSPSTDRKAVVSFCNS